MPSVSLLTCAVQYNDFRQNIRQNKNRPTNTIQVPFEPS